MLKFAMPHVIAVQSERRFASQPIEANEWNKLSNLARVLIILLVARALWQKTVRNCQHLP
jgi:hypothetical protein